MALQNISVASSADDARQSTTDGTIVFNDGVCVAITGEYWAFRFTNVQIAQGATVNGAVLRVQNDDVKYNDPNATIYGHAIDDAPVVPSTVNWISTRPLTTANVVWAGVDVIATSGLFVDTPDLAAIIQEVVNRPGWVQGNDIMLVLIGGAGTNRLNFGTWDHATRAAPELRLDYVVPPTIVDLAGTVPVVADVQAVRTVSVGWTTADDAGRFLKELVSEHEEPTGTLQPSLTTSMSVDTTNNEGVVQLTDATARANSNKREVYYLPETSRFRRGTIRTLYTPDAFNEDPPEIAGTSKIMPQHGVIWGLTWAGDHVKHAISWHDVAFLSPNINHIGLWRSDRPYVGSAADPDSFRFRSNGYDTPGLTLPFWIEVKVEGELIRYKMWKTTDPEPVDYMYTVDMALNNGDALIGTDRVSITPIDVGPVGFMAGHGGTLARSAQRFGPLTIKMIGDGLEVQQSLAGSIGAVATTTGAVVRAVPLAGNVPALVRGAGVARATQALGLANAGIRATASGVLVATQDLGAAMADIVGTANLAGALSVSQALGTGDIPAVATVSGTLSGEQALDGTAPSVATAEGMLTTEGEIGLSGTVPVVATVRAQRWAVLPFADNDGTFESYALASSAGRWLTASAALPYEVANDQVHSGVHSWRIQRITSSGSMNGYSNTQGQAKIPVVPGEVVRTVGWFRHNSPALIGIRPRNRFNLGTGGLNELIPPDFLVFGDPNTWTYMEGDAVVVPPDVDGYTWTINTSVFGIGEYLWLDDLEAQRLQNDALTIDRGLDGETSAVATVSGSLSVERPLGAGTVRAVATATGTTEAVQELQGSVGVVAAVDGAMAHTVQGVVSGVATATGALAVTRSLTGSTAVVADIRVVATVSRGLSGSVPAVALTQATLARTLRMSGSLGVVALLLAGLNVRPPGAPLQIKKAELYRRTEAKLRKVPVIAEDLNKEVAVP